MKDKICELADKYAKTLDIKIKGRVQEMEEDDNSHYLIYRVLGVDENEGKQIDIYQNKGRFLYNYAGRFIEDASKMCFLEAFPNAQRLFVPNTEGTSPKRFEIDVQIENLGIEIKWRDATTDGDHVKKERRRVKSIKNAGYIPVRVMFFHPNREQALKIQDKLKTLYHDLEGEYYTGENAWDYIKQKTGIDLLSIIEDLALERS